MESVSILWMQSTAILQHGFARNPPCYLAYPATVYRGRFQQHSLWFFLASINQNPQAEARATTSPLRRDDYCADASANGRRTMNSHVAQFPSRGLWSFATIARLQKLLCVKCCRGNAGQAIFRVRQG